MGKLEKDTSSLYGKIFTSFTDQEFNKFQEMVLPTSLGEDKAFFEGKKVLELGCGGLGYGLAVFLSHGAKEVTGIDFSEENINNLNKKFSKYKNLTLLVKDLHEIPPDFGSFDIVYSNGVVHHCKNPKQVVEMVYSNLKPGGHFFIGLYGSGGVIPFLITVSRYLSKLIPEKMLHSLLRKYWRGGTFFIMDYLYVPILRRYTEEEAKSLLERAGFINISRLDNTIISHGWIRFLQQAQMNHKKFITRVLHGAGYIYLKAEKPNG
jgi:SAM-dependent methyltransferase